MVRTGWTLENIASGNLSLYAFDDENAYDPIRKLQEALNELYGERVKYGKAHEAAIMMDEWFQEVYIDEVHFNISDEFGITTFMTYDEEGNQYIREIAEKLKAIDSIV